ncbi:hypothetical protein [Eubacterium aggregans]|uniref:hypothetical protein n=1 Tax=Eubacterium aggregans TaxID=81409 RepID=UPI003F3FC72A
MDKFEALFQSILDEQFDSESLAAAILIVLEDQPNGETIKDAIQENYVKIVRGQLQSKMECIAAEERETLD